MLGPGSVSGSQNSSGSSREEFNVGRKNNILNALFGVFFILNKNQKKAPFVVYLTYAIDYAVLLSFHFRQEFPWSRASRQYLSLIAGSIQVRMNVFVNDYQTAVLVWALVTCFVGFCLAIVVYVARGFHKNRFRYVWPIQFLSAVVSVLVTVLLVPILNVYLVFLNCTYVGVPRPIMDAFPDRFCWDFSSGGNGSIAIVSAMFVVLMVVLSFCVVLLRPAYDPTMKFPGEGPSQKFEGILMMARTVLSILGCLITRRTTILGWFSLAVNGLILLLLLVWCPYFSCKTLRVRTGIFAALTWASLCLVICVSINDTTSDAVLITLFIGQPGAAALGVVLATRRLNKISGLRMVRITRNTQDGQRNSTSHSNSHSQSHAESGASKHRDSDSTVLGGAAKPAAEPSSSSRTTTTTTDDQSLPSPLKSKRSSFSLRKMTSAASMLLFGTASQMPQEAPGAAAAASTLPALTFEFQGKFNTDVEVELSTRFVLTSGAQQGTAEREEHVGAAKCLWEQGIKTFPDSVFLMVNYANFLRHVMRNDVAADVVYSKLQPMRVPLWARFVLFCFHKDIESKRHAQSYAGVDSAMDVASLVEFQKSYRAAIRHHWEAILAQKRLWRNILTGNQTKQQKAGVPSYATPLSDPTKKDKSKALTLGVLSNCLSEIWTASTRAQERYQMLLAKYSQAPRLLRAYAAFVHDIHNDNARTQDLLRQAELIEDSQGPSSAPSKKRKSKRHERANTDSSGGEVSSEEAERATRDTPKGGGGDTLTMTWTATNNNSQQPITPDQITITSFSPGPHGISKQFPISQQEFESRIVGRKFSEFFFWDGVPSDFFARHAAGGVGAGTSLVLTTLMLEGSSEAREEGHPSAGIIPSLVVHATVRPSHSTTTEGNQTLSLSIAPAARSLPIGGLHLVPSTGTLTYFDESLATEGLVSPNGDRWSLVHPVKLPQFDGQTQQPLDRFHFWNQSFLTARGDWVVYEFLSVGAEECVLSISYGLLQQQDGQHPAHGVAKKRAAKPRKRRHSLTSDRRHHRSPSAAGSESSFSTGRGSQRELSSPNMPQMNMISSRGSDSGSGSGHRRRNRQEAKRRMLEMIDINKKSSVWYLKRRIQTSLLIAVVFMIGAAVSVGILTNQALQNVDSMDLGGDVPTFSGLMMHEIRSIDLLLLNRSDAVAHPDMAAVGSKLVGFVGEFRSRLASVYDSPAASGYDPITQLLSTRSVVGVCPDGVIRHPGELHYDAIECSYNLVSLAQKYGSMALDAATVDWAHVASGIVYMHFQWLVNFGPNDVFQALLKLPVLFQGCVLNFLTQMNGIQSGVQSACIGVMILLAFGVLNRSLGFVLDDRLDALRIFKMIPPEVAESLLSRPHMFSVKELHAGEDSSDSESDSESTSGASEPGATPQNEHHHHQHHQHHHHHHSTSFQPHAMSMGMNMGNESLFVPMGTASFGPLPPLPPHPLQHVTSLDSVTSPQSDAGGPFLMGHDGQQMYVAGESEWGAADEVAIDFVPHVVGSSGHLQPSYEFDDTFSPNEDGSYGAAMADDSAGGTRADVPQKSVKFISSRVEPSPTSARSPSASISRSASLLESPRHIGMKHGEGEHIEDMSLVARARSFLKLDLTAEQRALKREEKEVKESPYIHRQRKIYEVTVAIIVGLLLLGIALTSSTMTKGATQSVSLALGNMRLSHLAAARFQIREYALNRSQDNFDLVVNKMDMAMEAHFALIEGSDKYNLPHPKWKGTGDPQQSVLYSQQCLLLSDTDEATCPEPDNKDYNTLMNGLNGVILSFIDNLIECLAIPTLTLTTDSYIFAEQTVWPHMFDGSRKSTNIYRDETLGAFQSNMEAQMIIVAVVILCIFFLYWGPFHKIIEHLPQETEQSMSIVKLLPEEVVSANPHMAAYVAKTTEQLIMMQRERNNDGF